MSMLYKYVNSKEFKSRLEIFAETFKRMSGQIDDEVKKSTISFEKRRGALDVLQNNIFSITGRLSGIVGTPLIDDSVDLLEQEHSFNLVSLFLDDSTKNEC